MRYRELQEETERRLARRSSGNAIPAVMDAVDDLEDEENVEEDQQRQGSPGENQDPSVDRDIVHFARRETGEARG